MPKTSCISDPSGAKHALEARKTARLLLCSAAHFNHTLLQKLSTGRKHQELSSCQEALPRIIYGIASQAGAEAKRVPITLNASRSAKRPEIPTPISLRRNLIEDDPGAWYISVPARLRLLQGLKYVEVRFRMQRGRREHGHQAEAR